MALHTVITAWQYAMINLSGKPSMPITGNRYENYAISLCLYAMTLDISENYQSFAVASL
ncbi:hypothetical protein [Nostoc sp.]